MDLTRTLLRFAAGRPHVLLAAAGDGAEARLAVEAELARLGWPSATSPADADLLVVVGTPGPQLAAVMDEAWRAVPAPRARVMVRRPAEARPALRAGAALLADLDHQRATQDDPRPGDHEHRDHVATTTDEHGDHVHEQLDHGDQDQHGDGHAQEGRQDQEDAHGHGEGDGGAGQDHGDHGADGEDHSGHGDGHHGHHGHGGMEVAGLPMADLGEDRDGLTLDRLHVPLGPVLPDWPPGLVLRVVLQGDVVQEATAEVLDDAVDDDFWADPVRRAARELDALARLLGVLGWADPAATARRVRDELVAGAPPDRVGLTVATLLRRIRRSRVLRWQMRGVPVGPTDLAALIDARLGAAEATLAGEPVPVRPGLDEVVDMLVGAELAAARLVVAAADPSLTAAVPRG